MFESKVRVFSNSLQSYCISQREKEEKTTQASFELNGFPDPSTNIVDDKEKREKRPFSVGSELYNKYRDILTIRKKRKRPVTLASRDMLLPSSTTRRCDLDFARRREFTLPSTMRAVLPSLVVWGQDRW